MQGRDVMTMFIECIYEFFDNPSNIAEFEKWRKERKCNDEIDLNIRNIRSDCSDKSMLCVKNYRCDIVSRSDG